MRCPSVKTLVESFRGIGSTQANLIRALAKAVDDPDALQALIDKRCPETCAYVRSLYSSPYGRANWRRTVALHAIDQLLGTYGVEGLGECHMIDGPPYQYCNAGDPYVATLVYDRDKDRLMVACWGDLAESDRRLA